MASHVKADFNPRGDCAEIEVSILEAVLAQSVGKMSEQEKAELFAEFGGIYKPGRSSRDGGTSGSD